MDTATTWKDVRISVDVTNKITYYLDFLQTYVNQNFLWENPNTVKRAFHRYERFWLPLVAEWKSSDLEPPRDIKWAWHLHMLNPKHYVDYCKGRFGKVVPHKIKTSSSEEKTAKERTARVWKDKYLHEPYELEIDVLMSSHNLQASSRLQHLVSTSSHQSSFLYQVLLPHYNDATFLRTALDRYRQFIFLQKIVPNFCGEPPYDIHLLWRIHMLHPCEYQTDMEITLRHILDPHDTLAEVTGYMTSTSDAEDTWYKFTGESLFVGGTLHRGAFSKGIQTFPKEYKVQEIIDTCDITIDDVVVSDVWTKDKDIIVEAKRIGTSTFNYESIFTHKGKVDTPITSSNHRGLGKIKFDSKYNKGIEFHIYCHKGRFCFKAEKHIATVFYNPTSSFEKSSFYTRTLPVEIPKVSVTDPYLKFTCQVKAVDRNPHIFTMDRTNFTAGHMPSDLLPNVMLEPFWSQSLAMAGDEDFLVAKHEMKSKMTSKLSFGCQVVKHDDTESAGVLIYINNKQLVCVAHSISTMQLPNVDQVSRGFPLHIDPDLDHAMLIRNSIGDWCIVKGSWMTETMPGYGKVQITIYNLQKNTNTKHVISDDELHTIKLEHVTIDMPTGRLTLRPGCEEMAENIALSYCVGILFLTCQRKALMMPAMNGSMRSLNRLKSLDSVESFKPAAQTASRFSTKMKLQNKKRTRKRKMSASFTFLLACGLQVDSYYYQVSQPSSRNSTITLNDVPVIMSKDGDVKFVANTVSNGHVTSIKNGSSRGDYNDNMYINNGNVFTKEEDDPFIQDIRL